MEQFGKRMAEIHKRFLVLPCPTVAAMNGHAFAGGAFMALSCDYRIMREDRGWFCVSEVDVGVPIPPAMMGILQGKLPANTARDALLTGKRYTADEAIAAGIADGKRLWMNSGAGQGPGQPTGHQGTGYLQNPQANLVRAHG